jgi:hypothetical protein
MTPIVMLSGGPLGGCVATDPFAASVSPGIAELELAAEIDVSAWAVGSDRTFEVDGARVIYRRVSDEQAVYAGAS